jgi:hypothetical protein
VIAIVVVYVAVFLTAVVGMFFLGYEEARSRWDDMTLGEWTRAWLRTLRRTLRHPKGGA